MNGEARDASTPPAPTGESPSAEETAAPRSRGPRSFGRLIVGLVVFSFLVVLLRISWSGSDPLTWYLLGGGAALGAIALVGWKILALIESGRRGLEPLAWIAFPMAFFGSLAMVPILVLAVYPRARVWLDPQSLIVARHRGERLEIVFPRDMRGEVINLTFDATPVPPEHFVKFTEHGEWRDASAFRADRRILSVDLAALRQHFDIGAPRRVGINAILDASQVFDARDERILQQWVVLPGR